MQRTPEVIDVWFDSGSMPFAQYHYPFENKKLFERQFPADVICEGIDQTRGWFYSLLAVSTLFTGQPPYKRVLSLGHILDEKGQKMSKSKKDQLIANNNKVIWYPEHIKDGRCNRSKRTHKGIWSRCSQVGTDLR